MSSIEAQMGEQIYSRVKHLKASMRKTTDGSFYNEYTKNTKYLLMFSSASTLQKFEALNYPGFKIPTPELRQKIIDKMFNKRFDFQHHGVFEFTISDLFTNLLGTFNGGAIMTLIDVLTFINGILISKDMPVRVSASITTHFLKTAFAGDKIYIKCQVDRQGRRLVFYSCEMYNAKFEKIAMGSHVMTVLQMKREGQRPELKANPTSKQRLVSLLSSIGHMNMSHKNKVLQLLAQNQRGFLKTVRFDPKKKQLKTFIRRPLL